jgi:hypothetical protein
MKPWQLIFYQSKANDAAYFGDRLPTHIWYWPRGTWFQTRLRDLRRSGRVHPNQPAEQSWM